MNWYRNIFASIWNVESEPTFEGEVGRLYELGYKYDQMRLKPFNGLPQRREKMLAKLKEEAWDAVEFIHDILDRVISKWLESHALLSAETWANARINDLDEYGIEDDFDAFIGQAMRELSNFQDYRPSGYGYDPKQDCTEVMQSLHGTSIPEAEQFMNEVRLEEIEHRREDFYYQVESGEYDGVLNGMDPDDYFEANIELQVETMTLRDYLDMWVDGSCESLIEILNKINEYNLDFGKAIVKHIYQHVIFPKWFARWQPEGIEETRKTVEHNYKILQSYKDKDLPHALAAINIALQTVHQNGSMLDYIDSYGGQDLTMEGTPEDFLDEMTNLDTSAWDEELREVGVQVAANNNWYTKTAQPMGLIGPARQTTGLFGNDEILDAEPGHKNNINLFLNKAARELSAALQEPDLPIARQRMRKAVEYIAKAQRRVDFV